MNTDSIWSCPVCGEPLGFQDKQAHCCNNHRFDRAKQGYYNLLLANQKRSEDPGDTREMMLKRREFLNHRHYEPLALHLQSLLVVYAEQRRKPLKILDSGCGEGYYLNQLQQCDLSIDGYGLDISREAVKLAARSYPQSQWVVSSSFNVPVQSGSVDLILRVFAPGNDAEAGRILAPEGELWRVSPGPEHLLQLKARLYDKVQHHSEPRGPEGFVELSRDRLKFNALLNSNDEISQLLGMTPFVWQSSADKLEQVQQLEKLDVQADFIVQRFGVNHDGR